VDIEFITYKKFNEQESLESLTKLLDENSITYELAEDRDSLDSLYGHKHFNRVFYVKIKKEDFPKADDAVIEYAKHELNTVDGDYYLFKFSGNELFDILSKPDEWSEFDYQLARKILQERGEDIDDKVLADLKSKRISEIAKPLSASSTIIYAGYIMSLLGGIIGVFIGISLATTKKTLPDGHVVYVYSENDRRHGMWISVIGMAILIFVIVLKIIPVDF
jgi:hypothetical protein